MAEGTDGFGTKNADDAQRLTVDGRYVIELDKKLPDFARCPAFSARDKLSPTASLLALAPESFLPARDLAQNYARIKSGSLLSVRSVSDASGSLWVICDTPGGFPLTETSGWTESSVIERVIVPLSHVLHAYHEAGLTHRAIRPDNVFDSGGRTSVVLGPALTSPPAYFQPARFEALSSAICDPAARGNGSIADDIFSLGALAVWLLGGCVSYWNDPPDALLTERFAQSSFAVLTEGLSLSQGIAPLLAAMLSDDPTARPLPRDLFNAGDHKGFVVRRPVTATAPLQLGTERARTAGALAWLSVRYRQDFANLLVRGLIERWLSYELGLPQVAARLSHLTKDVVLADDGSLASSETVAEIISILDPTLPLYWNGMWFWPDAIGQMLVTSLSSNPDSTTDVAKLVFEVFRGRRLEKFSKSSAVPGQPAIHAAFQKMANEAIIDTVADVLRLPYLLNQFLPCLSPRCAQFRFSTPWALISWLNTSQTAAASASGGTGSLLDSHMVFFLAATTLKKHLITHAGDLMIARAGWPADLLLLARVQHLYEFASLPGIGRKLLPHLSPELKKWRSRKTRKIVGDKLVEAAMAGDLESMQMLLSDIQSLRTDQTSCFTAQRRIHEIENEQRLLSQLQFDVPPAARNEMVKLATAVGVVCAVASLCYEIVL